MFGFYVFIKKKKKIKSIGLKEIKLLETVSGKSGGCVLYQKTVGRRARLAQAPLSPMEKKKKPQARTKLFQAADTWAQRRQRKDME